MIAKKRLQVFISSTTDLIEERQAAVEAILSAGHIPAGMELFAAGDESQMEVIRRWIDESDVFLLILGGRYGSIEPKNAKSYVHLEYEHALNTETPLFAVVEDEEHLRAKAERPDGREKIEREHPQELKNFRDLVLTRIVKLWKDPRDIKLAIHEAMGDFERREALKGWIRGDQAVNAAPLADEIARLSEENARFRKIIEESDRFSGMTFNELKNLLTEQDGNGFSNLLSYFYDLGLSMIEKSVFGKRISKNDERLVHIGLIKFEVTKRVLGEHTTLAEAVQAVGMDVGANRYTPVEVRETHFTDTGRRFMLRLMSIATDQPRAKRAED